MKDLLNSQVKMDDGELADHDFDVVRHENCNYNDDGKGLQIDVERIIGDATDGVSWSRNHDFILTNGLPSNTTIQYLISYSYFSL